MNVDGNYIVMGDPTCDQRITIDDLLAITAHMLGISTLTGDAFTAADLNNDGVVDVVDLGAVNMHRNGIKMITEVISK